MSASPPTYRLRDGFAREWRRMRSRPLYLLLLLILPLAGWGILAATFYEGVPRNMPVAIIDHDNSAFSRELIRAIDATSTMRVETFAMSPAEGEDLMKQGDVYAVVLLDHGLERDIILGNSPPVVVFYNAQWMLPTNLIVKDLRTVFGTVSATTNIKRRVAAGESLYEAMRTSEPIRFEMRALHNPELDYTSFLLPALLAALMHIFVTLITIHVIGTELKHRTADAWLAVNNDRILRALFTKLSPYFLWYFLLGAGLFHITYGSLGVPFRGTPAVLIGGYALLCLAYMGVGMLLIALTANLRLATSLASFITGPAFAFAGITFPVIAMPTVAKIWALALPLTHFSAVVTQQGVAGYPAAASIPSLQWLGVATAILCSLSALLLGRVARNPEAWGRV